MAQIDRNIGIHVCVVNDLFSWDKEILDAAETNYDIVNAISIVMNQHNVDAEVARSRLAMKVPELELRHDQLLQQTLNPFSMESQRYIEFLVCLASGNESWSRLTARYNVVGGRKQKPEVENISFRGLQRV